MQDGLELFPAEEMQSPFDVIKETDAEGREWWNSRKLAKHQGLVPVSHKNIIYPAVGKEQTAKGGVFMRGEDVQPFVYAWPMLGLCYVYATISDVWP